MRTEDCGKLLRLNLHLKSFEYRVTAFILKKSIKGLHTYDVSH